MNVGPVCHTFLMNTRWIDADGMPSLLTVGVALFGFLALPGMLLFVGFSLIGL